MRSRTGCVHQCISLLQDGDRSRYDVDFAPVLTMVPTPDEKKSLPFDEASKRQPKTDTTHTDEKWFVKTVAASNQRRAEELPEFRGPPNFVKVRPDRPELSRVNLTVSGEAVEKANAAKKAPTAFLERSGEVGVGDLLEAGGRGRGTGLASDAAAAVLASGGEENLQYYIDPAGDIRPRTLALFEAPHYLPPAGSDEDSEIARRSSPPNLAAGRAASQSLSAASSPASAGVGGVGDGQGWQAF